MGDVELCDRVAGENGAFRFRSRRAARVKFGDGMSFLDVFLPLYCIFGQYFLGPVTIGNWILGVYALVLVVRSPTKRFRFDGLLLLFVTYAIISQPLRGL